jgi:hypothetical protein
MRTLLASSPFIALVVTAGCSSPVPTPPPPTVAAAKPAERIQNKAGEFLVTPYDRIANDIFCVGAKRFPEAAFEQQTITPETLAPGQQFTHTLVYTVCAKDLEQFVGGTLYRKIYMGNRLVHSEPKPLDLKPGRWKLNALIEVPEASKTGTYELRTEFVAKSGSKNRIRLRTSGKFEVSGSGD